VAAFNDRRASTTADDKGGGGGDSPPDETEAASLEEVFCNGGEIFHGYVPDRRNTDHAWVETAGDEYYQILLDFP
jgi:hypothetical protein